MMSLPGPGEEVGLVLGGEGGVWSQRGGCLVPGGVWHYPLPIPGGQINTCKKYLPAASFAGGNKVLTNQENEERMADRIYAGLARSCTLCV